MAGLKEFYNQQAQKMIDSFGGNDLNPQLASEALQTQSTEAVSAAAMTGDPLLDQVIGEAPQPNSGYAGGRDKHPGSDSKDFWKEYQQWNQGQDAHTRDMFAGVNGIPVADPRYIQGTMFWVQKDKKQRDEWRKLLDKTGSYISTDDKNNPKVSHPGNGDWSAADTQALMLYMRSVSAAPALFSKDGDKQKQAINTLNFVNNALGIKETAAELSDRVKKDPKAQTDFAIAWVQSHPDQSDQRHLISQYVDMYGDESVPAAFKNLHDGRNLFEKIVDAPGDAVHEIWGGLDNAITGLTHHIPIVGGGDADQRVEAVKEARRYPGLTPDQLRQLGGAVQDMNDHKGWLSTAQQAAQEFGTKAVLTSTWSFGAITRDLASGHASNIGDDLSHSYNWADAHKDNMMAGVMGDEWAKQHSSWTAAGNFASSLVFDPTNLLGPVGRIATVGKDLNRIRRLTSGAEEVATDVSDINRAALAQGGLKNQVEIPALARLRYSLNPEKFMTELRDKTLPAVFLSDKLSVADRMRLLDVAEFDTPRANLIHGMHDENGVLKSEHTEDSVRTMLHDHFENVMSVGGTHYNYQSHLKMLSPEVQKRLSAGGLTRMMAIGGFKMGGSVSNFSDKTLLEGIETLEHVASVAGVDRAEVTKAINKIAMAPEHERADLAMDFYDKHVLGDKLPKGFSEWLASRGASKRPGADRIPRSLQPKVMYAPDPRLDHPAVEMSVAPRRLEDKVRVLAKRITDEINDITLNYMEIVKHKTGGDSEAHIAQFEADVRNKPIVDGYRAKREPLDRKLEDAAPMGTERAAPMFPGQLAQHVILPFDVQDLVVYNNPILRKATSTRAFQMYNKSMQTWKLWEVAKPSTAIRASGGDDTLRWSLDLADWGSPEAAAQLQLTKAIKKNIEFLPKAFKTFVEGQYKGARAVISDEDMAKATEILGPELSQSMHSLLDRSIPKDFGHLEPEDGAHYREALTRLITDTMNHQFVRDWALHRSETGATRAKEVIADFYKSSGETPDAMRTARGFTHDEAIKAIESKFHNEQLAIIDHELQQIEARAPKYVRGPKKGQPKIDAGMYKELYSKLPKRSPGGLKLSAGGSYLDRVMARRMHHSSHVDDPNPSFDATINQTHDFLEHFFKDPNLRKMMASGKVDSSILEEMLKSDVTRSNLPRILAPMDGFDHAHIATGGPNAIAEKMMERFMGRMVTGARADGYLKVQNWMERYLTERYKGNSWWTPENIEKESHSFARNYLKNNVYMGMRTLGDTAMGKMFPFSGAALSFDRFLLKHVKTRPWIVGKLERADQWVQDQRNSPHGGGVDLNPLSWFGYSGGMHMFVHPENIAFFGGNGWGSVVPGLPPVIGSMTAMLAADSGIRRIMEGVPGWKDSMAQAGESPIGALQYNLPSYMRHGIKAAEDISGISPESTGSSSEYDKILRERTAQGLPAGAGEVQRQAALQEGVQALTSWLLPIAPHFDDPIGAQVDKANHELHAAKTRQERDAIIAKYPEIKDILVSKDPALTGAQVGKIESQHPEIIPYRTSMYRSGTGAVFDDPSQGLPYSTVAEYNTAIKQERENAIGWALLRQEKALKDQWHMDNPGVSTSSPDYKDWAAQNVAPIHDNIQQVAPEFYKKYIAQVPMHDMTTERLNSQPIVNLTALYALPQDPRFESPRTNAIRNIMKMRDDVAHHLVDLHYSSAPHSEVQQAIDEFHKYVVTATNSDPELQAEMDLFHWSQWTDFLDLRTKELIKEQSGG